MTIKLVFWDEFNKCKRETIHEGITRLHYVKRGLMGGNSIYMVEPHKPENRVYNYFTENLLTVESI